MKTLTLTLLALLMSNTMLQAQWEQPRGLTENMIHTVVSDPDTPGKLYAGTEFGLFVSQDNGQSWTLMMNSGMKYKAVWSIAKKDGMLLATSWRPWGDGTYLLNEGLPQGDVSLSVDGGRNWTSVKSGLHTRSAHALAPCSSGFLAATPDGIFRTTDTGTTWTLMSLKKNFHHLTSASCGLFATSGRDIYRSQDDGLTWQQMNLGMKCYGISGITGTGNTIYASASMITDWNAPGVVQGKKTVSVLFRSTDAGEHWSTLPIPASPLIDGIYALGDTVIAAFHSNDPEQGSTVRTMTRKPALNLHDPLRNDGDPPQHAAKGEWPTLRDEGPAGVHVSIDGGRTWTIANEGLPVTSMDQVMAAGGNIFVISDKSLLFRRPMSELVAAAKAGRK